MSIINTMNNAREQQRREVLEIIDRSLDREPAVIVDRLGGMRGVDQAADHLIAGLVNTLDFSRLSEPASELYTIGANLMDGTLPTTHAGRLAYAFMLDALAASPDAVTDAILRLREAVVQSDPKLMEIRALMK